MMRHDELAEGKIISIPEIETFVPFYVDWDAIPEDVYYLQPQMKEFLESGIEILPFPRISIHTVERQQNLSLSYDFYLLRGDDNSLRLFILMQAGTSTTNIVFSHGEIRFESSREVPYFVNESKTLNRNVTREQLEQFVKTAFCIICTSLMIINSKHTEKIKTEIPDKLNKKRVNKGKNRLSDYITVRLSKNISAAISGKGTGKHPKPHWRRGHVRRLPSGKITSVQACVVNWDGSEIEKKKYRIQNSEEHGKCN